MTMHGNNQDGLIMTGQPIARREFLKKAAALGGSALALSQLRLSANAEQKAAEQKPKDADKHAAKPAMTSSQGKPVPVEHPQHGYNATETIQAKTFANLSTVEGITQSQLNQHLELYNGYVKKINDIQSQIITSDPELGQMNATYSPYRELHVEQTYALNGVILHEYYFENIGGAKKKPTETEMVHKLFTMEFGSWDNYVNHLLAVGKSMRGWAITGYNMRDHRIHNYGLDLHNQWVPVNVIPLLVLDVYEHAYMIDFGTKRAAYLDAFMHNVDWAVVDDRLKTMILHG
jgi:superoxide dismutase, Fe-Mn family